MDKGTVLPTRETKTDRGREGRLDRESKDFILAGRKMVSCIWYHPLCRTCAGSVQRGQKREASSAKWKFLCFSHSCTMTLQMAVLPFVQPPGINPNHNGITSEKKAGKIRLYYLSFWKYLCREEKGAQGPWLRCYINLHLIIKHTHANTHNCLQISVR